MRISIIFLVILLAILAILPWLPALWLRRIDLSVFDVQHNNNFTNAAISLNCPLSEVAELKFNPIKLLSAIDKNGEGVVMVEGIELGKIQVNREVVEFAVKRGIFPSGDYFKSSEGK
jgi:hypothetical protein